MSWASSAALEKWSGRLRVEAVAASFFLFSELILNLIRCCLALMSFVNVLLSVYNTVDIWTTDLSDEAW